MARTHVQQSQISGSLSTDISDSLGTGSALEGQGTLVGDLNALRSQINKIIGGTKWYDALSGSQNLADIEAAMHVAGLNADFQGTLDVTGVATFDAAITGSAGLQLAGDLDVNSSADFQGAVNMQSTLTVGGAVDVNAAMDVSGQVDLAASTVATNVRGTLDVAENATFTSITGSAGLKVDGDADFNSTADFAAAVNMQSTLNVSGKADFAGIVDVAGTLSASAVKIDGDVVGRMYLVGADGEIQDSDKMSFDGSLFQLTGSADISSALTVGNGINVLAGGLTVAGDSMEITGSFAVSGSSALDGALSVSGLATLNSGLTVNNAAADFNADVTANKISIDSDVAQRLYIVDADGSIKDEENLTFDGSELLVTGSAKLTSNLTVEGGVITLSNGASIDSDAVAGELKLDEDLVVVTGDLKVSGNDISGSSGLNITLESAGDVTIAGVLKLMGNQLKSSAGNVVLELNGDDAFFKSDVNIAGDLYVKGAMTYIETTNLKVQDAFIHLATGSTGAESSGIVLHGGAGATDDLLMAQDAGAGEFVFGKLAHSSGDHSDIDGDNTVAINNIALVPAWMSELKVGDKEGSFSGSFAADASGAKLYAAADLLLAAHGADAISFISGAGEKTSFDSNFTATTVIGAINELYSLGAGGSKKGNLGVGNVSSGTLTFSSVGTLVTASQQFIDVYLNGVLLAYGADVSNVQPTTIDLDATIVLNSDDVLTVVLRGAT